MYDLKPSATGKRDAEENNAPEQISRLRRLLPQVIASVSCSFVLMALCLSVAFPTVVIGSLLHAEEDLTLNDDQASWLGSIAYFCQPFGSVLSSVIVETLGRRRSMLLLNLPYLAGFILLSVANSYTTLVVANVLLGIIIGLTEAPLICYIGEVTQAEVRGTMIGVTGVLAYVSWLLEWLLGAVTTWRIAIAISGAIPIIAAILMALVPESPMWLISKNRIEDARKALCWLRGWVQPEAVEQELHDLINYHSKYQQFSLFDKGHINPSFVLDVQNTSHNSCAETRAADDKKETQKISQYGKIVAVLRDMISAPTLRPLTLVVTFFFFNHWAGLTAIRPFMIHVFDEFQMPIPSKWVTVLSAAMCIAGTIVLVLLVRRCGKRAISLVCIGAMAVLTVLLGVYAYVQIQQDKPEVTAAYTWVPLILILAMSFINSILNQVPWMLVSEVFPMRTRGLAGGLSAAFSYIFQFLASKTYLDTEKTFRLHGTFWFYGCINIVGFVYLYLKLMETEGRTLEEIEVHFTKGECPRTMKKTH